MIAENGTGHRHMIEAVVEQVIADSRDRLKGILESGEDLPELDHMGLMAVNRRRMHREIVGLNIEEMLSQAEDGPGRMRSLLANAAMEEQDALDRAILEAVAENGPAIRELKNRIFQALRRRLEGGRRGERDPGGAGPAAPLRGFSFKAGMNGEELDQIKQVIHELDQRTKAGTIRWSQVGSSGHLTTSAGRYTVIVTGRESVSRESVSRETSMKVLGAAGGVLDEIRAEELEKGSEAQKELESLQEGARRQALDVDSHLDLLLREIEGTASACLVGAETGRMRINGEAWQPMKALIEHLEPGVAAGLAGWQPGAQAGRRDADKIRKALGQRKSDPGGIDRYMADAGFTRKMTGAGIAYTMGIFSLPKREIDRLDEFLKECQGFTVERG